MFFAWLIKFYEWNSDSSTGVTSALIKVSNTVRAAASGCGNTQPSAQQGTGKGQGGDRRERGGVAVRALVMFGFGLATTPKSMQHSTRHIHLPHCVKDETRRRSNSSCGCRKNIEAKKYVAYLQAHTSIIQRTGSDPRPPPNCLPFTTSVPLTVAINYGLGGPQQ